MFKICLLTATQTVIFITLLMMVLAGYGGVADGMMPVKLLARKVPKDILVLWDRLGRRVLLDRKVTQASKANKGYKDYRVH